VYQAGVVAAMNRLALLVTRRAFSSKVARSAAEATKDIKSGSTLYAKKKKKKKKKKKLNS
jgi:hypothetical protein